MSQEQYAYGAVHDERRYRLTGGYPSEFADRLVEAVARRSFQEEVVVIDFGCGVAQRTLQTLRPLIGEVAGSVERLAYLGLDHNPDAIAQARNERQRWNSLGVEMNFRRADLTAPLRLGRGFLDGADLVVSSRVMHALPSSDGVRLFLENVQEVLKPDGVAVISAGSTDDWKWGQGKPVDNWLADYAGPMDLSRVRVDSFKLHLFDPNEFLRLVMQAGLRVNDTFSYHDQSGYRHLQRNWNAYVGCVATRG